MTRPRNTLLLAIGIGFVGIGLFLLTHPHSPRDTQIGLMSVTLFGGATLANVARMVDDRQARKTIAQRIEKSGAALFRNKQLHLTLMAFGALLMAGGAALALRLPDAPAWALWPAIAFAGPGGLVLLWFGLDSRVKIAIDHHGVHDRRLTREPIPWGRITGAVWTGTWRMPIVIRILVDDPVYFESRRPGGPRPLVRPLLLNPIFVAGGNFDIANALQHFAPDPSIILPEPAAEAWDDEEESDG